MNEEISTEHEGVVHTAAYSIFDDVLTVYLPDGTTKDTELRGLKPESTAKAHLRAYIKKHT
ncbi:hypothetical protein BZG82_00890 [Salinivibrio sp. PR5]|nr:hypothetical protein BZG82_00890 [Salinivibrio sp. PR5]